MINMKDFFDWALSRELGKPYIRVTTHQTFRPKDWAHVRISSGYTNGYYLKVGDTVTYFEAQVSQYTPAYSNTPFPLNDVPIPDVNFSYSGSKEKHILRVPSITKYNVPDYDRAIDSNRKQLQTMYSDEAVVLVSVSSNHHWNRELFVLINPPLGELGLAKMFQPIEPFVQELALFLMKDTDSVNHQTDKEKVVSHGFDLKKSFRH